MMNMSSTHLNHDLDKKRKKQFEYEDSDASTSTDLKVPAILIQIKMTSHLFKLKRIFDWP